jgi:GNAT superfamily N-acetyltransferase
MSGASSDRLRAIAYKALAVRPSQHRHLPGHHYVIREGASLLRAALPGFSRVTVFGGVPPPERIFAVADEFFAGVPGGYTVMLDGDAGHPMEDAVRARGWQLEHDEPGMVLPAIPEPPPPPPGLEIRRVTNQATLEDFWGEDEPVHPAPPDETELPVNLTRYFNPSLACALDPDIALFVGYADGRPVASAGLYRVDDIAEIGAVWTAPAYRRRGFGAALTWAALAEGKARGCVTAALRATEMGYPVYLRVGFVTVCRLRVYAPAPLPGAP